MQNSGAPAMPGFTAPAGWTQVRRLDHATDTALLVYWHTATAVEPTSYTWQFSAQIEGVAWISCYANVDPSSPIDAEAGLVDSTAGPAYATPSITTTAPNAMLVATFVSHLATPPTTWSGSAGTTVRASFNNGTSRSGLGEDQLVAATGPTGARMATASSPQDYALVHVLALRPLP